jgi:HEAT repeat protein
MNFRLLTLLVASLIGCNEQPPSVTTPRTDLPNPTKAVSSAPQSTESPRTIAPTEEPSADGKPLTAWIKLLESELESDRWSAVTAIEKLGPAAKAAVPALSVTLKDKNALLGVQAAWVLGEIGADAKMAVPALIERLNAGGFLPSAAAIALGKIGPEAKAAVPDLIEVLTGKTEGITFNGASPVLNAAEALGKIGPDAKMAVPALNDALHQQRGDLRVVAALALWRIEKRDEPVTVLKKELTNKDGTVRCAAAEALWRIQKDPESLAELIAALKDKDPATKIAAARSLGTIGDEAKRAVPDLVNALKENTSDVKLAVLWALEQMGKDAKPAVPRLLELMKDRDVSNLRIRIKAEDALRKIDREAADRFYQQQ